MAISPQRLIHPCDSTAFLLKDVIHHPSFITPMQHITSIEHKIKAHTQTHRNIKTVHKLEIRSMERGICLIAVLYFAVKRSFFNI